MGGEAISVLHHILQDVAQIVGITEDLVRTYLRTTANYASHAVSLAVGRTRDEFKSKQEQLREA